MAFVSAVWFVFAFGFKGVKLADGQVPFLLHLLSGYLPWLLFSESVSGSMNAIVSKRFLLRQAAFQPSILPLVKFGSAFILHLVFLVILVALLVGHGYQPTIYWLQLPVVILLLLLLVVGLGWLTSSLRVFSSDIAQLVGVVLQIGFWMTPIFWSLEMLSENVQNMVQLNPMVFIVESYRDVFIRGAWVWRSDGGILIYLLITLPIVLFGGVVFKRLRSHFGDMI